MNVFLATLGCRLNEAELARNSRSPRPFTALAPAVAACALTLTGCAESESPLVGTWTTHSPTWSLLEETWEFRSEGTFTHRLQDDGGRDEIMEGWWQLDGDDLLLDWSYGGEGIWPHEMTAYVDGELFAMPAYLRPAPQSAVLAGSYVTESRQWNPVGTLVDAYLDWVSIYANGDVVHPGFGLGTWTEGRDDELRWIDMEFNSTSRVNYTSFYVLADGVLAQYIYARQ
jgi:hypothetical protein